MRKTFFFAVLLLVFAHSPAARADQELPPPILFIRSFLELTDEQTQTLIQTIQAREAAVQPIAQRLHANQEALGKLLESQTADAASAGRLLLDIRADEREIGMIAQNAAAQFEQTLTEEQRHRLQVVRQAAQVEQIVPAFRAAGLV